MISDHNSALKTVRKILSADFACEERCFDEEGVFFSLCKEVEGARRFPFPDKFLSVVTMGSGVVINCTQGRLGWARKNLGRIARDDLFAAPAITLMGKYVARDHQLMTGPDLKYICTPDSFQSFSQNDEVEISLIEEEGIPELYENNQFPNALGKYNNPRRPRMIAAMARCRGEVAGLAAAAADCDIMWQIGVDTLPAYRHRGIAGAMVSALTKTLFQRDILPYYSTAVSNIASIKTALSLGYRPAWAELYSRDV
jgi:GNAT superfamily N-acetyltransferase